MSYRLEFGSARVEKQYEKFPLSFPLEERQAIAQKIEGLQDNPRPHGCKKVKGNVYRLRFGDWRVVYRTYKKERIVAIAKIAKRRKGFYKEFE